MIKINNKNQSDINIEYVAYLVNEYEGDGEPVVNKLPVNNPNCFVEDMRQFGNGSLIEKNRVSIAPLNLPRCTGIQPFSWPFSQ